jgi:hypothetical protein
MMRTMVMIFWAGVTRGGSCTLSCYKRLTSLFDNQARRIACNSKHVPCGVLESNAGSGYMGPKWSATYSKTYTAFVLKAGGADNIPLSRHGNEDKFADSCGRLLKSCRSNLHGDHPALVSRQRSKLPARRLTRNLVESTNIGPCMQLPVSFRETGAAISQHMPCSAFPQWAIRNHVVC